MQERQGHLAIPKKLIRNNRLVIPARILENFNKNQTFKVEIYDNCIRLTAVAEVIVKTNQNHRKESKRIGIEYTMPLENTCQLVIPAKMRESLKLETAADVVVVYEGANEIFVIPKQGTCAFCRNPIKSIEEKAIIRAAKGIKKAICKSCAIKLMEGCAINLVEK